MMIILISQPRRYSVKLEITRRSSQYNFEAARYTQGSANSNKRVLQGAWTYGST